MSTPSSSRRCSVRTPRSGQTVDRAPPPRFPSIPQLSASQSLPTFDDFTPSFHDFYHSTAFSPTRNQQHTLRASPDPFSSQGTQSHFATESPAPKHDFNTANMRQRGDGDNFNISNIALNGITVYNPSPNIQTNHLTSTANLEPFLNLGSWQNNFTTTIPPTNAALTTNTAETRVNGTGRRYLESGHNTYESDTSGHISRTSADAFSITRQERTSHDNFSTSVQNRYNRQEHEHEHEHEHDRFMRHIQRAPLNEQQIPVLLQDGDGTGMGLTIGPGLDLGHQQTTVSAEDRDPLQSGWTWHDGSTFPDEYWQ